MRQAFGDSGLALNTTMSSSHVVVAAEALPSELEIILDFEVVAGYLLFDASEAGEDDVAEGVLAQLKQEIKLTPEEEIVVAEVFYASIKTRLDGLSETDPTDKQKRKRTKQQREDAAEELHAVQRRR